MKNIIYNSLILCAFLISTQSKAQHLLEALEGGIIALTPSEKCLELVKDKYYGDGDHNFIYCAVMGPNGKKWLNHNLGAEYSREPTSNNPNPHFNPEAVPTGHNDWKAFGSLFQYGRDADGHELGKYDTKPQYFPVSHSIWTYELKNPARTSSISNTENSNQFVMNIDGWLANGSDSKPLMYANWSTTGTKDPCPPGYRIMNESEAKSLIPNGHTMQRTGDTGNQYTATLLEHLSYPNLKVMLSPVRSNTTNPTLSSNNRMHTATIQELSTPVSIPYNTTNDLINGVDGTAGLWISHIYKCQQGYFTDTLSWGDIVALVGCGLHDLTTLDSGIFGLAAMLRPSEFGIMETFNPMTKGGDAAKAIRCIEK